MRNSQNLPKLSLKLSLSVLFLSLAACGSTTSGTTSSQHRLSPQTTVQVARADAAISVFCADAILYTAGQGPRPSRTELQAETDELDTLIRVYRADPTAIYQPGGKDKPQTMRQLLADRVSSFGNCDRTEQRRLSQVLVSGASIK